MTDLIRRLAAWMSLLLVSPGRAPVPDPKPPAAPWPIQPLSLPRHRSPYGLDTPLDATAARAVRPYVTDPYCTHGLEVA
ncbi:hypothetical protein [Streptomyces sp. NPDC001410]|uniref:hypothetical protein n=1 Tax=Streptomyces sp. NPDC001410 TaxID=3364574 RepID=UPI00368D90CD